MNQLRKLVFRILALTIVITLFFSLASKSVLADSRIVKVSDRIILIRGSNSTYLPKGKAISEEIKPGDLLKPLGESPVRVEVICEDKQKSISIPANRRSNFNTLCSSLILREDRDFPFPTAPNPIRQ
jgi:hypothetical protein